jgi:ketosteroid isomerase-like protein
MPSEKVESLRRANDAWNRGDLEAFLAEAHPDLEWHTAIERVTEGVDRVWIGHEQAREAWDAYHGDAWQKLEVEHEEVRGVGERVLALGRLRATGRTTEIVSESPVAQIVSFRDGKIAHVYDYLSHEEALEALGLPLGNRERVEELIAAVERKDVERLVELSDRDVEWHSYLAQLGEGGAYHGHEGLRRYVADVIDSMEFLITEVEDMLVVADLVLVVGQLHYRGRSGVEGRIPAGYVARFRDGLLVYMRAFRDPELALATLGDDST